MQCALEALQLFPQPAAGNGDADLFGLVVLQPLLDGRDIGLGLGAAFEHRHQEGLVAFEVLGDLRELVVVFGDVAQELEVSELLVLDRQVLAGDDARTKEHTSELQSLMPITYAVFSLKKQTKQ